MGRSGAHVPLRRSPAPPRGRTAVQHAGLPGDRLEFAYRDAGMGRCSVPAPAAWRLEYRLELRHPDGGVETVCDPANPQRVGGAFGDKSVLLRPDYRAPAWLDRPTARGHLARADRAGARAAVPRSTCACGPRRPAPATASSSPTTGRSTTSWPIWATTARHGRPVSVRRTTWCCSRRATATTGTRPTRRTPRRWPATCCPGCAAELGYPAGRPVVGDGREPRRARDAARAAPLPRRVRRAVPAVRQLLPAAASTRRSPASRATAGSSGSPGRCVASGVRRPPRSRWCITCGTAEENLANNREMAARPAPAGLSGRSCSRCPTRTTSRPGGTRSTRT